MFFGVGKPALKCISGAASLYKYALTQIQTYKKSFNILLTFELLQIQCLALYL